MARTERYRPVRAAPGQGGAARLGGNLQHAFPGLVGVFHLPGGRRPVARGDRVRDALGLAQRRQLRRDGDVALIVRVLVRERRVQCAGARGDEQDDEARGQRSQLASPAGGDALAALLQEGALVRSERVRVLPR